MPRHGQMGLLGNENFLVFYLGFYVFELGPQGRSSLFEFVDLVRGLIKYF